MNDSNDTFDYDYDSPGIRLCYGTVGAYQNRLVWYLNVYSIPLIALFGVVGNFINILVLTSEGRKIPSRIYLLSLAVCDCLFLLFGVMEVTPIQLDSLSMNAEFNRLYTASVLYIRVFASTFFKSSVMLVLAFNLERYFSVCHPLMTWSLGERRVAVRITSGIVVGSFLLSVYFPICYQRDSCYNVLTNATFYAIKLSPTAELKVFERLMSYASMTLFNIVPIATLLVLNLLLIRAIRAVVAREPRLSHSGNGPKWGSNAILFAVVLMFLICNGPQVPARIIFEWRGPTDDLIIIYMAVSQQLIFMNASGNFALYCLVSRRYRRALGRLIAGRLLWRPAAKTQLIGMELIHIHRDSTPFRRLNSAGRNAAERDELAGLTDNCDGLQPSDSTSS